MSGLFADTESPAGVVVPEIACIAPWFGGKRTLAPRIVALMRHPVIRGLYDGWRFVECPTTKALVNQGMRDAKGTTVAPEVLIVNGGVA